MELTVSEELNSVNVIFVFFEADRRENQSLRAATMEHYCFVIQDTRL